MTIYAGKRAAATLASITLVASLGFLPSDRAGAQERPGVPPDREAMYQHMKLARELAGTDLYAHYVHRCIVDQTYRRTLSRGVQAPGTIPATRVFDNLYFVGGNSVSAWLLDTGDGYVLFDALNSPDDIRNTVEPGMRQFGLDPAKIRYLVITHSHGDHYGGSRYLKDTYGTRILASAADWAVMANQAAAVGGGEGNPDWAKLVPDHDLDVADGQQLQVGNSLLTFYVTPGHTAGTVSTVFRVGDGSAQHTVGFFGGLGTPATLEGKLQLIGSAERFKSVVRDHGIDVLIANHQTQDQSIPKLEELRLRHAGDPNPYVIGRERYLRYLGIQQECTRFAMAQQGQRDPASN